MYQYKARLVSNLHVIAEGHTVDEIEKKIITFKRGQAKNIHTRMNEPIEIIHIERDVKKGEGKETLIKVV